MKFSTVLILLLFSTIFCFSQLTVNYISAQQFAQKISGPGITISNAVFAGTDSTQMASFTGRTIPAFGFDNGVLLATGNAMVAGDTSYNYTAGNALGGGGDADLSGEANQQTYDLAAIEFDFTSLTDSVEFTFVFASEEYNYWVNIKNDICGAKLFNSGGGYTSVMNLPGTSIPVSINTVNNGSVPFIGEQSAGLAQIASTTSIIQMEDRFSTMDSQYLSQ
jgi:hypothetical protein